LRKYTKNNLLYKILTSGDLTFETFSFTPVYWALDFKFVFGPGSGVYFWV